jgi:HEAT repeat protein
MNLDAKTIVALLRHAEQDERPRLPGKLDRLRYSEQLISHHSTTSALVDALDQCDDSLLRQVICRLLWERCDGTAVPALVTCLDDTSQAVRDVAADGLGHLGDTAAGAALLQHFVALPTGAPGRGTLAFALGGVGHQPAISALVEALKDPRGATRAGAAWALGALSARQTESELRRAMIAESEAWVRRDIETALNVLDYIGQILNGRPNQTKVSGLAAAFAETSAQLRLAAVSALQQLGSPTAEAELRSALLKEEVCAVRRRMQRAADDVASRVE